MKNIRTEYDLLGAAFPIRAFSQEEAEKYLEFCKELMQGLGDNPQPLELTQMHLTFKKAYELVTETKILEVVKQLIGADVLVWATSIFYKKGGTSDYIGWHQDSTYWSLSDEDKVASVWVALTDSNSENGSMRIVPCSHTLEQLEHEETRDANNKLSRKQNIKSIGFEKYSVPVVLKPGEFSLHHSKLIHGSEPNTSDKFRVGFVIRYIAPSVKQFGARPKTLLVQGEDLFQNFNHHQPLNLGVNMASIQEHQHQCNAFLEEIKRSNARKNEKVES